MINSNEPLAKYNDFIYSELKPDSLTQEEIGLINFIVKPKSKILDVGGGTGRHAIPLSTIGHHVTLIDSSKGMIDEILNEKDHSNNIEIINSDIYLHKFEEKFDLIILMWNTFNEIALTKKSAKHLLTKLKSILNTEGLIFINIDNADAITPESFDFQIQKELNSELFILKWKTLKYKKRTNTSISLESLEIYENSKLKEVLTSQITQRYWRFKEIQKICDLVNLNVSSKMLRSTSELYLIASIRN